MTVKRISAFATKLGKSIAIVPKLPTISSLSSGWNGLVMEHHFLSASECPEMETEQLTLSIKIGNSFVTDWYLDGKLERCNMRAGDIAVLPKGIVNSAVWFDRSEVLLLSFDSFLVNKIAKETLDKDSLEIIPQRQIRDAQIVNIALALKAELESKCLAGNLYGDCLINALIVYLLKKYSNCCDRELNNSLKKDIDRFKIKKIKNYINDNLSENLKLEKIAEIANTSPYYFARNFKAKTGYSPHQYIINCRIERAKELLSKTNLSIIEIAARVGCFSKSNFTSLFRKKVELPKNIAKARNK